MKKRQYIYIHFLILSLFAILACHVAIADIYSWTDENGVRHYSDNPPGNSAETRIISEIPHDRLMDEKTSETYKRMIEEIVQSNRESETLEIEKRLRKTERQLLDAEKKADRALKEAQEARSIALEKQRRRDVYFVPWLGPHGVDHPKPVPYHPPYNQPGPHVRFQ